MEKEQIERINELARKKKDGTLTDAERAEQETLRKQYLKEFRANMQSILDNTVIQNPDGSRQPLKRKSDT